MGSRSRLLSLALLGALSILLSGVSGASDDICIVNSCNGTHCNLWLKQDLENPKVFSERRENLLFYMQGTLANGSVPSENHNNSPIIIIIKSTGMKALYVEHVLNGQKLTANCTYRTERNSTQTDGDIMGSTGVITIVLLIVGIAIVLLIVGIIVWYKKYRRSADSAKSPETRTPQEMDAMISSNGVQQPGAHNVLEPTDQQNPVLLGQLMKQLCQNSILNKVILEKHF